MNYPWDGITSRHGHCHAGLLNQTECVGQAGNPFRQNKSSLLKLPKHQTKNSKIPFVIVELPQAVVCDLYYRFRIDDLNA